MNGINKIDFLQSIKRNKIAVIYLISFIDLHLIIINQTSFIIDIIQFSFTRQNRKEESFYNNWI